MRGEAAAIVALLSGEGMCSEGVLAAESRYWVAVEHALIVGVIGLELGDGCVLLRSAFVEAGARGKGIGKALTEQALAWARAQGYGVAYCFSTDAGGYWMARGFLVCPVAEVVGRMPDAPQVRAFDRLGWLPTEVGYYRSLGL